jgi:putative transposase
VEHFFQAVKYEHLYREEIRAGWMVVRAADRYRDLYNTVRPHEAAGFRTPLSAWRDVDEPPPPNLFPPSSVSGS